MKLIESPIHEVHSPVEKLKKKKSGKKVSAIDLQPAVVL